MLTEQLVQLCKSEAFSLKQQALLVQRRKTTSPFLSFVRGSCCPHAIAPEGIQLNKVS